MGVGGQPHTPGKGALTHFWGGGGLPHTYDSGASSLLAGTGFIGFSDVLASSSGGGGGDGGFASSSASFGGGDAGYGTSNSVATPFYTGEDADLKVVCKRLSKKDGVTKHKALLELAQLVHARSSSSTGPSSSSSSLVEGLVPYWLYVYPRLVLLEDDRRVREAVFSTALPQLFASDRKAMVGVLGKHLLGPWWAAMSDPQKEVANAAIRCFQAVFPKSAKRQELLAQAAPVILAYLHENLRLQAADPLLDTSGGNGQPEEAEERLERIVTCSLTALAALLQALDEPTLGRLLNGSTMAAAPPPKPPAGEEGANASAASSVAFLLVDGQSASLEEVFDSATWKFLSDKRPLVRRAAYNLLAAVAVRADQVIRQTGQVAKVAHQVCGLLGETETGNFGAMWEALLLFFHHFPKALTTTLDCKTQLFPRVLKLIRASFLGAAQASCPSLLPMVALMPASVAGTFYTDLLQALWKGAKADKNEGEEPYLVAIVEIATYLLVRAAAKKDQEEEKEASLPAELGPALVEQLLTVVAKVLAREGGRADGPASKALITALAQVEKAGAAGRKDRKCLLLEVDEGFWQGLQSVALGMLGLGGTTHENSRPYATVLATIQEAAGVRQTQGRAERLCHVLTSAHEKAGASEGGKRGLETTLSVVCWQCVRQCEACKGQPETYDALVPYLTVLEAAVLRLPFARLPAAAPSPSHASASSLVLSFLVPLLHELVAAAAHGNVVSPALKPLVGTITALNLGLGDKGNWQELLAAVIPAQAFSGAGGLGVLLAAFEAISVTYERVQATPSGTLRPLNELLSDAVAPFATALVEGDKAGAAKEEHVRFLAVCLGASDSSAGVRRGGRGRHQPPLLAPATVAQLVTHTLACRDEVGLEALVLVLDKGDKECPVLDGVRAQAAAILTLAFQALGPAGDVRIASVLSLHQEEDEEMEAEEDTAASAPSFRGQVVAWLRSRLAQGEQEEHQYADAFVRLVEILSSASHESASHFMPALLHECGLADAEAWNVATEGRLTMWRCLEAVMHALAEEHLLEDMADVASVLVRPGAPEHETVALLHQVLRAGVELGEPTSAVPGRASFAFSRFLGAAVAASGGSALLPSDRPFQLFFPSSEDVEKPPLLSWAMAHLLAQVVEVQLVALGQTQQYGASLSWHDAYTMARLVALMEGAGTAKAAKKRTVNQTAWTRVVLPKELTACFDSPEELQLGTEVWYFDRRVAATATTDATDAAWKRGTVAGIHRDDVEKYFTVQKASGGETQMEFSRLRRGKPSDIGALVAGVCEGLPDLQFAETVRPAAVHASGDEDVEDARQLATILGRLRSAAAPWLENATSDVPVAWTLGEIIRGIRALIASAAATTELAQETEQWLEKLQARWCASAEAALDSAADQKLDWARLSALLTVLAALPPLGMAKASSLWQAVVQAGVVVTGATNVPETVRVAALGWMASLRVEYRDQDACVPVLEELWAQDAQAMRGARLAALDLGLQTVLEQGALALRPSTKVALFRLALRGLTAAKRGGPATQAVLAQEVSNRCRVLAVALIPFDNRDLAWTTHIYAADPAATILALNMPLWNAHIDALLEVLSAEDSPGLHMSALHLLRPYLRSATDVTDDEEEEEEDEDAVAAPTTGAPKEGGETQELLLALTKGPRAKALASDASERSDMARDLRIVGRRLPPRLHRLLQSWLAPASEACAASGATCAPAHPQPTQRLVCLLEWDGLLETVGGDGGEDGPPATELAAYRGGVFQALLAWLLFMEHVEGVAQSPPLRDAYSTYIALLGVLPVLLQACFRVLGRRLGAAAASDAAGREPFELQDLWATAHVLSSSSPSSSSSSSLGPGKAVVDHGGWELRRLVAFVLFRTIVAFPALVRKWWSSDCERWLSTGISKFVEEQASARIVQREIDLLLAKGKGPDCPWGGGDDEIVVRGSAVTREVTAHYFKDDCTLEVLLRLPLAYPLRNVEVECTRSLGVSADKWNRWQLQIVTLLSMRDGSVVDAVALWVRNLQKEFEGMEPCPICMSTIEARNLSLPERECRTCHNKFHNSCILRWMASSGKGRCVICQQSTIG